MRDDVAEEFTKRKLTDDFDVFAGWERGKALLARETSNAVQSFSAERVLQDVLESGAGVKTPKSFWAPCCKIRNAAPTGY